MSSSRSTTKARRGFVYAPLEYVFYPYWKIKIIDNNGVTHWIADFVDGGSDKNFLINASVNRINTTSLSHATITFDNNNGRFTDVFNGGEIVEVYADYTDASTLQFRGKIDDVNYSVARNGFSTTITARDYPELIDTSVIGRAVSSFADVAICDLLNNYYPDIKLEFWNGSSWIRASYNATTREVTWSGDSSNFPDDSVTFSYQNRKGWQVLSEICKRVGLGCYLEYDSSTPTWTLRTFLVDQIQNNEVSITYGSNLISCNNYGKDNTGIFNNITVYGKQESDNILLLATETDTSSISDLWQKDKIINDPALTTMDEVREKAKYELEQSTQTIYTGRIQAVGMHNIKPGEQIMISIPNMNVAGYYTISRINHNISPGKGYTTTIDIKREDNKFTDLFKEKLDVESEAKPYINLNGMKDSYTIYFDENPSIMTHSNTEEKDGKLVLSSGKTTGIATSKIHPAGYNVTYCEFRKYSNFPVDENDVYEVSNDGGVTWETYDITGDIHKFNSTGGNLRIRLTLNRANSNDVSPAYESLCLLYR